MRIENMHSRNRDVPNQFIIHTSKGTYFQSYYSLIAFIRNDGVTFLGPDWDNSKTTGKYRNQFLNETKKETEKKIKDGVYILKDLTTIE